MDPQIMAQLQQGAGQPPAPPMAPSMPQQTLPKDQSMIIVEALIKQLERLDAQKQLEMGVPPKGMGGM